MKYRAVVMSFLAGMAFVLSLGMAPRSVNPYPAAPLCVTHDPTKWHGLWNAVDGCHYDHEHGDNPFTPEVAAVLPFDIAALLGGTEIGSMYPTSAAEPTTKHGGFKWFVMTANPGSCVAGFEGAANCVAAAAIQVHAWGDPAEQNGRIHSAIVFLKVCRPANPTDCGYVFAVGHVDYGQRVAPYQNTVLAYPDNFAPTWPGGFGPYWSTDCRGNQLPGCRNVTMAQWLAGNYNASSTITNKPTGSGPRPVEPILVRLLSRVRDNYTVLDSADTIYPYTFKYVCGNEVYNPAGCRYNNSTLAVHEAGGEIPASWDGAAWDNDSRPGYVSGTGMLDGLPFQVINMPVGKYGSSLCAVVKCSNPTPVTNPEHDIYFLNGLVVSETTPGALPSGWIGDAN